MDKTELGSTGILVSRLGLGTVKFGRNEGVKYPQGFNLPDDRALANLLAEAKEMGINVMDTAPAYGTSEERLGDLLHGQRGDWVIVGKAGEEFSNGESSFNFSPAHFNMSLERSLKRLRTDYIDVFLIHSNGDDEKILSNGELIRAMQDFKRQGLVRAIGASTKTTEGGLMALEKLDVAMVMFRKGDAGDKKVLDYAAQNKKGILLKKILESGHASDPAAAIDFVFSHPAVSSAIIGTINAEHLRENVRAAEHALASRTGSRART